jgi:hypothetical protein
MYRFKKQYQTESIVYKGRLITSRNLKDTIVADIIKNVPSLANRFELIDTENKAVEEPKAKDKEVKVKIKTRSKKAI